MLSHEIALGVALALVEKPSRCRDPYLPTRVAGIVLHRREQQQEREAFAAAMRAPEIPWGVFRPHFSVGIEIDRPSGFDGAGRCLVCGHNEDRHGSFFGCSVVLSSGLCGCPRR